LIEYIIFKYKFNIAKNEKNDQSLVGSVVIDVELGRENHDSTPPTAIGRGLESLDVITDHQTRLNLW
jgi:hypothetical protein